VVTEKDRLDLKLISRLDPEYVAMSFIGSNADTEKVRATLKEYGNEKIKLIAKLERPSALENLDDIIGGQMVSW